MSTYVSRPCTHLVVWLQVLVCLASFQFTLAESIPPWNFTHTGELISSEGLSEKSGNVRIKNPSFTVLYDISVSNAETGEPISCGSTIPLGTKIRYAFKPHERTDISWFVTGGIFDSPYGNWSEATLPPKKWCDPLDFTFKEREGTRQGDYVYGASSDIARKEY